MKKILVVLSIFSIISIISVIVLFFNVKKNKVFMPPEIEQTAITGVPSVDEDYKYSSLDVKDGYSVGLAGHPRIVDQKLYLYFTSLKSNDVLIKLKVFYKNKEVGSTGLIEPGKYIETIQLKDGHYSGKLILKIMGYEKDTYQSAGAVDLNLKV